MDDEEHFTTFPERTMPEADYDSYLEGDEEE